MLVNANMSPLQDRYQTYLPVLPQIAIFSPDVIDNEIPRKARLWGAWKSLVNPLESLINALSEVLSFYVSIALS